MRHGTEAQESAPNPGKAVRGQAKTTATALFSLPSGAVPVYDVRRESRWHGHVVDQEGNGFCTGAIENCRIIARLLNEAAAQQAATDGERTGS